MSKIVKKHKRLTPNESVSLIKDTVLDKYIWRHRYETNQRSKASQELIDYPHEDFETIDKFKTYIEDQPKPKGYRV